MKKSAIKFSCRFNCCNYFFFTVTVLCSIVQFHSYFLYTNDPRVQGLWKCVVYVERNRHCDSIETCCMMRYTTHIGKSEFKLIENSYVIFQVFLVYKCVIFLSMNGWVFFLWKYFHDLLSLYLPIVLLELLNKDTILMLDWKLKWINLSLEIELMK